ncbi:MAG: hypothetical protein J6A19_15430 [Oscillospiraceae bacterium]|nr:hypothetical protein [Oscillospiraceae bacterium]
MTAEEVNVIITAQNLEFNNAINGVINRLDDMEERTQRYGDSATGVFKKVAQAASALGIGKIISDSIMSGGELEQNLGGAEVVFRQHADSMRNTAKTAFKDMGLSESGYLATANKMGALLKGSGYDIASAAKTSQQVMQRASDVASIMGIDVSSAMEAVTGAAKGNFTMMDNLGVAINDTTLQIYAQEKGLGKLETTQQKVSAAMQMFLEKTEYAAGNYARENDTFSGSLTTFKEAEIENLTADLGTQLLPTATSLLSMARSGLEAVSPLVVSLGEGINQVATFLTNLSPTAKTMLTISLLSAVAIPAVTKAQLLYNAANAKWKDLLNILIPKEITRANVLKATVGWLAIIAGMLALVADIGATAREMNSSEGEAMQDTADGADTASESVDGLADSYAGLGNSADSAKKSLLDIDTLNVFGGSESTGGVDFAAVAAGAEGASDVVAGLTNDLGGLSDELDNLNNFSLDGLGSTFSTTFSDIGTGFSTLLDAFNFDSDTQLSSLRVLDKKVRDLFGDGWSDFWTDVGSTLYQAFGDHENEYARSQALTDIQNWLEQIDNAATTWTGEFGKAWSEFWRNVGMDISSFFRDQQTNDMSGEKSMNSETDTTSSERLTYRYNSIGNQHSGGRGGGGGRVRAVDTSQYQYADYSDIQQSPSSGIGQMLSPEELSSRLRAMENGSVINLNLTMQNEIDLDGDKVGESVTTYQSRENARSNGY